MSLLILAILLQDPELDAALKAERDRVAAKKPLSADEANQYVAASTLPRAAATPKKAYSLAVVPLEFSDTKLGAIDAEKELGRLAEFYRTMSGGTFALAWKVRPAVTVGVTRAEMAKISAGSHDEKRLLAAAAKAGDTNGVDGVLFLAAGSIGDRETALWPHEDAIEQAGRKVEYMLVPEGSADRRLGILAHEFAHLLGLEDKYEDKAARVGRWCLLGTGYLGDKDGNPMPLCGVCREKLGWASAAEVDARTAARVSLSEGELVRVPMSAGAESLVLEMRGAKDLLVWRTGGGKPIELAGAFPSEATDRMTPYSDPPLLGRTLGAHPVWVTDVRIEGGRAYVRLALDGELTPLEELRRGRVGKALGK